MWQGPPQSGESGLDICVCMHLCSALVCVRIQFPAVTSGPLQELSTTAGTIIGSMDDLHLADDTWSLEPDATLAALRPLPYTEWQRDALGNDLSEYVGMVTKGWRAAAGHDRFVLSSGPWSGPDAVVASETAEDCTFLPYVLQYLAWGLEAPKEEFARCLLWDYRASLLACQMHACRAGTCSKGWLGRHGFCRLGFWHLQDVSSEQRPRCWLRRHGREIRYPACVRRHSPALGTFETERHHHWLGRHNLTILLTRPVSKNLTPCKCVELPRFVPGNATMT